jgi:biopolymer transport protein ExbD
MQLTSGYETRKARIEMVPLLDVVFLLLVFFIYAMLSMSVYRGVHVTLPSATGEPEGRAELVTITVTADNEIMINETFYSLDEAVRIAAHESAGSDKVLIYGDRSADLGVAMELLSKLRNEGVAAVSFLVKKPPIADAVGSQE